MKTLNGTSFGLLLCAVLSLSVACKKVTYLPGTRSNETTNSPTTAPSITAPSPLVTPPPPPPPPDIVGELWTPDPVMETLARVAPNRVGAKEVHNVFGHAMTWDGALLIKSNILWVAQAFRPNQVTTSSDGQPDFSKAFSPAVPFKYLGGEINFGNYNTIVGAYGNLGIAKDESIATNPFPSDAVGNSLTGGTFLTYQFLLFTQACGTLSAAGGLPLNGNFECPAGMSKILGMLKVRIVLASAGTDNAVPVYANIYSAFTPITFSNRRLPIAGIEPTVSIDGRLLVWQGHPRNNGYIHNLMYSWNPNPNNVTGWSFPKTLHKMHAEKNTLVGGIALGKRFPLALEPLRDIEGNLFDFEVDSFPGAYPWLSPDGSEIFFTTTQEAYYGIRRSGYSALGRMTGWSMRHLDGPINHNRYGANLPTGPASPVFFSSPGAYGSRWDPGVFWNSDSLPYLKRTPSYGLFGSNTAIYTEVSFEDHEEKGRVVFLHMNEMITKFAELNNPYELLDYRFDPTRTPDTSGNRNHGHLGGEARFPQEYRFNGTDTYLGFNPDIGIPDPNRPNFTYRNCSSTVAAGNPLNVCIPGRDKPIGFLGQGVYLADSGYVSVANSPSFAELDTEMTASVFVKRLRDISVGRSILFKPGTFQLAIERNGQLVGRVETSTGSYSTPLTAKTVPINAWAHLAMTYRTSTKKITLYIDGEKAGEMLTRGGLLKASISPFIVGPAIDNSTMDNTAYWIVDEVSLSSVAKNAAEIQVEGYIQSRLSSAGSVASKLRLPLGLPGNVPLTNPSALKPKIVALGQKLFFDPILSKDGKVSCATCHNPNAAFADKAALSKGINGQLGTRNSPTLINGAFSFTQMWDGKAASLEDQALMPIVAAHELGLTEETVLAKLNEDKAYVSQFKEAMGEAPNLRNLAGALAAFQRTILSGDSPYDKGTLSAAASRGKQLFFGKAMCASCHRGPGFTDERFHNTGLIDDRDEGRKGVTQRQDDVGAFKTPTLRNVAQTAPYLHNGAAPDLTSVVQIYNAGGLPTPNKDREIFPLGLTSAEVADVVEFLNSLTGTVTFGVDNLK